jgi:succinate-semialdehyde dehydrogenase/glutarate-semialdehyde dehydrogenase
MVDSSAEDFSRMGAYAFIEGKFVSALSGKVFDVRDPATDSLVGRAADCGIDDAKRALEAGARAGALWAKVTADERSAMLRRIGEKMEAAAGTLADLMVAEQGKPRTEALAEINSGIGNIFWAAEEARRIYGETVPAPAGKRIIVIRQPVGLAAAVTPWNFPFGMIARKLAPALACGCAMIIKPAEQTPLSALFVAKLVRDAGLPAGLVAVLPTLSPAPLVDTLLADPRLRKLSFTGSVAVGKTLWAKCANQLQRVSLELGGQAPALVLDDADIDLAVAQIVRAKFRNAGQTCISINRVFAHAKVHDQLVAGLKRAIAELKVGPGTDESAQIGPLINDAALRRIELHCENARALGATLHCGGQRVRKEGWSERFFAPTLLSGVSLDAKVLCEETFGPILPVAKVKSNREAVELANGLEIGLAAYVFGSDYRKLTQVAETLEFGIVAINDGAPTAVQAPFGGWKSSGVGRENGHWSMDEYLETKYIALGDLQDDALLG